MKMIISLFFADRITIHDFIPIIFMLAAFKTILQVTNFTT